MARAPFASALLVMRGLAPKKTAMAANARSAESARQESGLSTWKGSCARRNQPWTPCLRREMRAGSASRAGEMLLFQILICAQER